ncbi:unnamed protein product [Soboliphyme baturini]|uniref:Phosphorylase b kinase regulatory subunit n=1 Tax=Soboliphyme baturini TaxID=241478 RepID=A0A183II53_9BILA|nr:unnamed protein product [Soboliphyme baturini]
MLTYGLEPWIMTEKLRIRVQAAEMGFFRRVSGLTRFDMIWNSDIQASPGVQPLLLQTEKSQLRWFVHVLRMPPERKAEQLFSAKTTGRRRRGTAKTVLVQMVVLTGVGKYEEETDWWIEAVSGFCVREIKVIKVKLSVKITLSDFKSIFMSMHTYDHEFWTMTEMLRTLVQAAEMGLLRRVAGLTLLDMDQNADIRESLGVKPLLFQIEKSQLRWFVHVLRMPSEKKAKQLFLANPIERMFRGRPRLIWCKYMEGACSRLQLSSAEAQTLAEDRERGSTV